METDLLVMTLQITTSLLLFINKILLLTKKRIGWILGICSGVVGIIYFCFIELYIFTTLNIGLTVIYFYGYFFWKDKKRDPQKIKVTENIIRLITIIVMTFLIYFTWNGLITSLEFSNSLVALVGTYFMAEKKIKIAWLLYIIGNSLGTIIGYKIGQIFFADFQLASVFIAIIAFIYSFKD